MIKIKKVMQLDLDEISLAKSLKLVKIYDYVEKTDFAQLFNLCFIDKTTYCPKEITNTFFTKFYKKTFRFIYYSN